MLKTVDFYYFSPTGGTKKVGSTLASEIAETVNAVDLADKTLYAPSSEVAVVAAPVFGGRMPEFVTEKLAKLDGTGKKAVTAVVYGVRAYEDALIELNDVMEKRGFEVIASAALIAQHSIVPEVGAGRPDRADITEIQQFAKKVINTIKKGTKANISVPGNRPYKETKKGSATPISLSGCTACACCSAACPTEAITVISEEVITDVEKCMMCMACVAGCPTKSRILPTSLQEGLAERLSVFKDTRRENEFYI